jgi:hypothetical protein
LARKKRVTPRKFKTVRSIKKDQYVVFRSARSGKIVKYRKNRKYIVEVRSKKSKKVQGYLNTVKKKGKKRSVIPRKFTKSQISLKTRKRVQRVREIGSNSFTITMLERFIPQFRHNGRRQIETAVDQIHNHGDTLIGLSVAVSDGSYFNSEFKLYTDDDANFDFLAQEFAILSLNLLRSEGLRTSPKMYDPENRTERIKQRKMRYRKAVITIKYGAI